MPLDIDRMKELEIDRMLAANAARLLEPSQKKLGVLRLQGWGNPETTQTGVKDPEHATKDRPYTRYAG